MLYNSIGLIKRGRSNSQEIVMSSTSSVVLNTGVSMPLVGFGTYNLCESGEVYIAVDAALQAGYRAFDTAAVYRNEADLGRALRDLLPKHGLTREDIFITRYGDRLHIYITLFIIRIT